MTTRKWHRTGAGEYFTYANLDRVMCEATHNRLLMVGGKGWAWTVRLRSDENRYLVFGEARTLGEAKREAEAALVEQVVWKAPVAAGLAG